MSNLRKIIQYDPTLTNGQEVDSNGSAQSRILDANGDPYFTQANPAYIQADDLDIRALDPAIDEVVVQAVDLDIRDLDSASDSVEVEATDLDIRDLSSAQDSIEVVGIKPDGTNTMPSMDAAARRGYTQNTDGTTSSDIITHADDDTDLDGKSGEAVGAVLYGRIDADTVKPIRIDGSTHSIQTIDYAHHETHGGSNYDITEVIDLPDDDVLDIQIVAPAGTKLAHWVKDFMTEAHTEWWLYENVTINTAGTTLTPRNHRRDAGDNSIMSFAYIVSTSIANANSDTAIAGATQLAHGKTGTAGAKKESGTGGAGESREEWIFEADTSLTLRFHDQGDGGYIAFHLDYYEHTDKD